jgi:hypothetical protein
LKQKRGTNRQQKNENASKLTVGAEDEKDPYYRLGEQKGGFTVSKRGGFFKDCEPGRRGAVGVEECRERGASLFTSVMIRNKEVPKSEGPVLSTQQRLMQSIAAERAGGKLP